MTNKDFGKFVDGKFEYAQDYLVKPNGGIIIHPTDEQYRAAGYLPVEDTPANPPKGQHAVSFTRVTSDDGTKIVRSWVYEENEVVITISKSKVEAEIDAMGKTTEFVSWLNSKAQYIGAWLRGDDGIVYDPTANESDLMSLMAALGITAEQMPSLIAKVVV